MRVAVTGATGQVGSAIAAYLLAQGHAVTTLGRRPALLRGATHHPYDLTGPPPDLKGMDALVHAAFSHIPGRYRGGEGDDPAGFRALNLDGTLRLFARARDCGVGRILFLSSRAVYGDYSAGTALDDGLHARPDTLYGRIKAEAEDALFAMAHSGLDVANLRATGVYGPTVQKWADLFAAFDRGETVSPRVGTEVHADDLAAAVDILLRAEAKALRPATFNVSDILLDRHDLLATYADLTGRTGTLPDRANPNGVCVMRTERLTRLGWKPRGPDGLRPTLQALISPARS